MSAAVTIREHVLEALAASGPHGLTMAAVTGAVKGPWREHQVAEVVRKLWGTGELARRQDGTFAPSASARKATSRPEHVQRSQERLQAAVHRLAAGARRDGFDAPLKVRRVDPALLEAFCAGCMRVVRPRLDGTCVACGTQTGANLEQPKPERRRRRRRPLRNGQTGYGPVCPRCGESKTVQAHICHACRKRQPSGYQRGKAGGWQRTPVHITEALLAEARRLYVSGLSMRQVAAQVHPETGYKTVASCAQALDGHFRRRGWKLRPQRQVTAARNHRHGRKKRDASREQERSYRRWLAAERGWSAIQGPGQPVCKGVKAQPPRKGVPCTRPAMGGSGYCWAHDPSLGLERQAQLKRMRARLERRAMLPAAPFAAWLEALYAQHGTWRRVGQLLQIDASQITRHRRAEYVSVAAVQRSAARAGTSVEAIYQPTSASWRHEWKGGGRADAGRVQKRGLGAIRHRGGCAAQAWGRPVSAREWFAPGQVWRPRRGRQGSRLKVANVHRVDRIVEVIDAEAADRVTAKRMLMRFSDMRAGYRLEQDEHPAGEGKEAA